MIVPMKPEHTVCNWCGVEVNNPITYYKGKQNQIDYCNDDDNYCETKFQSNCEHNNLHSDRATFSECLDFVFQGVGSRAGTGICGHWLESNSSDYQERIPHFAHCT